MSLLSELLEIEVKIFPISQHNTNDNYDISN